ncbi:AAA family ATPase [Aeromicrobium sp.]|uniref:AAA family ATPase n=1 Tax=Aeromicrobium sp. TaxID=1871063 RepID=UPI004034A51C
MKPTRLVVKGLFGYLDHEVDLDAGQGVTIITGPNGAGKTHVLNILRALLELDFQALLLEPIDLARITFSNGEWLEIDLATDRGNLVAKGHDARGQITPITIEPRDPEQSLPPWIEHTASGRWLDTRDRRIMTTSMVERRYGPRAVANSDDQAREVPWLRKYRSQAPPIMIETGRLDVQVDWEEFRREGRRRPESVARIVHYAEQIRGQISEARRESLAHSQVSDRDFAVRALDKARATVKESELRARYARISELNSELHANGLAAETVAVAIPAGRTNPTERRILNLFLDDWDRKLRPLIPVHRKIQKLKEIVGGKLAPKALSIGPNGELQILSPTGEPIGVDLLSSGEQHLLALYTMLLFNAVPGGMVLIDEPEISLHASWKHAFLDDIESVVELNALAVVLATHSTAIINGRWELVQEIGLRE